MEDFLKSLENGLTELVTLQIVTAVGDVSVTITDKKVSDINIAADNASMVTRLNMLTGDQATYFGKEFVTGDYTSLQEYHAKQEEQGINRVKENIEALRKIIGLAKDVVQEQEKLAAKDTDGQTDPPAGS